VKAAKRLIKHPLSLTQGRGGKLVFQSVKACVFLVFIVSCTHLDDSEPAPKSSLELAAESILVARAGKEHFESVRCLNLECSFEYSTLDEDIAAKIADDAEAHLVAKGFPGVKISVTESLLSGLIGSIFFGLGMGLAAAVFGAL
jgi:hypothetical protein